MAGERKSVSAGSLQKGSFIIIDDAACRVTDVTVGKSGKHGHAKARIVAIGLLDEKKREIVVPSQDSVEVPIIEKKNAQVLSVSGDTANLMDLETYETFDVKIPEEFKDSVVQGAQVLTWDILGTKVIKQVRGAE